MNLLREKGPSSIGFGQSFGLNNLLVCLPDVGNALPRHQQRDLQAIVIFREIPAFDVPAAPKSKTLLADCLKQIVRGR